MTIRFRSSVGAFWKILANTCLPTFVKKLGYFFQHLVTIISKTKKLRLNSTILIFMNYAELRPWSVWPDSAILRVLAVKVFDILTTCNLSLLILSFLNGPTRPLFCLFLVFSSKHHYNIYNQSMWKNVMSIQYMVPGFKLMTTQTWIFSHNH